ncbi:hypothetical protein Asppvi_009464 [Aspergillus pseudoviridinutans]|uniref:Uncharacterized protein n=1 Tax=Aspergillus pseudoviridinutans TaxID=1517512 RepID=A0A9P3BKA1_9EURO|nr:uncharacterized protein Asppvi_009464 [Aspergillus pseudoviridinutans]GIJ90508.1 hypothetical protein Asppvi_009464 [Aspergillus pseudoviridinutans]
MSDSDELPYCIWYPSFPRLATCKELLRRVPSMRPAVARACILRDYSDYWDELDADPDVNLTEDARESPTQSISCMFEHTSTLVLDNVPDKPYAEIEMGVLYNGRGANMAYIELCVSVPDEVKQISLEELEETGGFDITEYYKSFGENRH